MFDTSLSALTAAGGNSRAARAARVKLQWRDRFGRWIEMGRGVKFKVRGADGAARSVIGSFVGAIDTETGQVYVSKDPNGLPDGFYDVKSANAQEFVANLSEAQLAEKGIELGKGADGKAVGQRVAEAIPNINEMNVKGAPAGWRAEPGTFGGKKVITTDDGDFRVHFGGKDETVLLEDHRAAPGQAEPQRSVAEAFKKVGDVDAEREASGDQAYTGLAADNDAALANRDRDSKVEQIKGNERTLLNERANLGAKQSAMTANEALKKELEDAGEPYDPEGNDSDEALAARKAAPADAAPAAPDATAAPTVGTGQIDLSTFEVAPEGFLVPTGKKTNDISRDGLAAFMTQEKEHLGNGGTRLVVDTDTGEAEIYNSAPNLEDAQAQAGGIGVPEVLDLSTGQAVPVGEPNPNAGDPNVDLTGETVNAQDSNPNAVEPGTARPAADAPASPAANGEARDGNAPAAPGTDPSREGSDPAAAPGDGTAAVPDARAATREPSNTPGSVEELKERRAQVQAALEIAGDPKDIVALNEQADALDNRIRREELGASFKEGPRNGEPGARVIRGEDTPETTDAPDEAPDAPEGGASDWDSIETIQKIDSTPRSEAIQEAGGGTPVMYELEPQSGAKLFRDAMTDSLKDNPYAASVYTYNEDEYRNMRLFLAEDGLSGVAVDGDNIVSAFSSPSSENKNVGRHLVAVGVDNGGTRLDAFDTVLPKIYASEGFEVKSRLKWDENEAPEGWDKETFAKFNGGEPDVVFMQYNPDKIDSTYTPGEGDYVDTYDDGLASTQGTSETAEASPLDAPLPEAPARGTAEKGAPYRVQINTWRKNPKFKDAWYKNVRMIPKGVHPQINSKEDHYFDNLDDAIAFTLDRKGNENRNLGRLSSTGKSYQPSVNAGPEAERLQAVYAKRRAETEDQQPIADIIDAPAADAPETPQDAPEAPETPEEAPEAPQEAPAASPLDMTPADLVALGGKLRSEENRSEFRKISRELDDAASDAILAGDDARNKEMTEKRDSIQNGWLQGESAGEAARKVTSAKAIEEADKLFADRGNANLFADAYAKHLDEGGTDDPFEFALSGKGMGTPLPNWFSGNYRTQAQARYNADTNTYSPAEAPDAPEADATPVDLNNLPVEEFSDTLKEMGEWRVRAKDDGTLELFQTGDILDATKPGKTRPLEHIYRVISEDEYNGINENGFMQSDGRMNIAESEGTVATHRDPSFYAPGRVGERGRIVRMDYNPEDGWWVDSDGYVKTPNQIPAERFTAQSDWTVGVGRNAVSPEDPRLPRMLVSGLDNEIGYAISVANSDWATAGDQRPAYNQAGDDLRLAQRRALHGGDGTTPNFDYQTTEEDARAYVAEARRIVDGLEYNGKEESVRDLDAAEKLLGDRPAAAPAAPAAPERPAYQEPGDADQVADLRRQLDEFDAGIESELDLAERASDPQEAAEHLARVRTFTRRRREVGNALDRALGNAPMDLNGELGWNMRDKENRGSLPEAPTPEPVVEDVPEADIPAVLDDEITPDAAPDLKDVGPASLREGDYIQHPETGNVVKITNIEAERYDEERDSKFTIDFESRDAIEEGENESAGTIELWGRESVDTFKGWRDRPAADAPEDPNPPRTREGNLRDAEIERDAAEADYMEVLMKDDYTDEEYEAALERRDLARIEVYELQETLEPETAPEPEPEPVEAPAAPEPTPAPAPEPVEEPTPEPVEDAATEPAADVLREIEERNEIEALVDPSQGTGGLYDGGDDPNNVSASHENTVDVAKAKMQGKELTPEELAAFTEALNSGALSDNQLVRLAKTIDGKPNRANTATIPRPADEQPEYLSTADVDVVNAEREDPSFVFDEDLTWRRIFEEFPDLTRQENGDLVLDSATNKGKRYDTMIRRTKQNRFLVYVQETDQEGNRRAKRIGNTEWHSYEALEKRITAARKIINSSSPAGSITRRKDQPTETFKMGGENLGTMSFPADDFLGDIGNPDAPVPATGDEKFDRLLSAVAGHIRNSDADLHQIEAHLQELDPGASAIKTIMQAVIGRAQDNYRPDGIQPWQMYDGETAEIGMEFDWTDWHQELNWWLPDGSLNLNRPANPTYGTVHRGRVMGYVKENTDGKGHTYGDHVWVSMQDPNTGSWGNWVKRSAQTLRKAEPGTQPGMPFFSKREEWRSSPEALARRFRVPNVEEPMQTKERPRGDLPASRRTRFTSRGALAGYSNVPVPNSPTEIISLITDGKVVPSIRPASEARPGMMIVRMDADGNQFVDSIIRVENLGDGGYRIHAARPDGNGFADVESFVVSGDADIALWSSPEIAPPRKPEPSNARRGELVEFESGNGLIEGVIAFDDDKGNLTVVTPGNETIDILESNIKPVADPAVSKEERVDLLDSLDEFALPQEIKDMISSGVLSPGLTQDRYTALTRMVQAFKPSSSLLKLVDAILNMIGASSQQRSDARDYFNE